METGANVRSYRIFLVSVVACLLAACNYGEDSSTPASGSGSSTSSSPPVVSGSQPPAAGDHAPQISGVPATTATVGQSYSFQPVATDADSDVLTFSLSGAPRWLTVNSATGRISGTPASTDVGSDTGIVVQVSDGKATVSLAAFSITVAAAASGSGPGTGSVDLGWVPPTENTDGSTLVNLNGYKIYYGHESKNYTTTITVTNPGLTSYVIDNLPPGTYFFSVTATTSSGVQSGYSPEASTTIS